MSITSTVNQLGGSLKVTCGKSVLRRKTIALG